MALIPIGVTDFKKLRNEGFYFVDKSMFIADVMRSGAEVTLLPRPRRFGKTMNLSMLQRFLDMHEDNSALFDGLNVKKHEDVMSHLQAWPVVFLTFKDVKRPSFESCMHVMSRLIASLFGSYKHLFDTIKLLPYEKTMIDEILNRKANHDDLQDALAFICDLLNRATGKKVMVLIDEYDMPIHSGFQNGYYQQIIDFMRNLLSGAFKDNPHLQKGVLTGILRVAKESIFSGFNNPAVRTLLDEPYSSHFGFTQNEVSKILTDFSLQQKEDEVRRWYNGYRFGSQTIYNPWSIMQYLDNEARSDAYWVNTSDNALIRGLITDQNAFESEDIEILLDGGIVKREVETSIVLGHMSPESVWSLLLFSGYLKAEKVTTEHGRIQCNLAIPNLEVRVFYETTMRDWVRQQLGPKGLDHLLKALLAEEMEVFADIFAEVVVQILSFHDTAGKEPEKVYHTFLLGMLVSLRGSYRVRSNHESGFGRYDIALIPEDHTKTAFLFEFKVAGDDPKKAAEEALQQIKNKDYAAEARQADCKTIRAIGIAVDGKTTRIRTRML